MICYYLFLNHTWPDSRWRAWKLAHFAVRQQAAVGVRAGPTVPGPNWRFRRWQLTWGHEGDQRDGAAGGNRPRRRPPLPPVLRTRARTGLRCPQPLHLWGEVLVGWAGRLQAGLFFLLFFFFRVCLTGSRCSSHLWGDARRCFLIFCFFSLFLLTGTRGEEGTDVVLLLFFKLREEMQAQLVLMSVKVN